MHDLGQRQAQINGSRRGENVKKLLLSIIITGALIGCAGQETLDQSKEAQAREAQAREAQAREAQSKEAQSKAGMAPAASEGDASVAVGQLAGTQSLQTKEIGADADKGLGNFSPNDPRHKHSVYYDYDKHEIRNEFIPMLEAHAKYLIDHPNAKIAVQGNTDERGSREYNIALGHLRAESVKKTMIVLGVPEKQIETVSFGKEKPKATCDDESCWKQNRRSDIVYKQ